jgi:hypothetical protein
MRTALLSTFLLASFLYLYSFTTHGQVILVRLNQGLWSYDRAQWWNWKETDEEIFCRAVHDLEDKEPIPNVVHYILLSDEGAQYELNYATYLAIKTVLLRLKPTEVKIHHFDFNTSNKWWKEIEHLVTLVKLRREDIVVPHGYKLSELALAHQSDVVRLAVLAEEGGIYLDTDIYVFKSFKNLLTNPRDVVLGHEGGDRYGLCNAVILARPGSEFISLWRDSYKTFNPEKWNEHSVLMPKLLQVQHKDLVCPLSPPVFYWPFWEAWNVEYMHEPLTDDDDIDLLHDEMDAWNGAMYEYQLAYHSWGGHAYLRELTPDLVQEKDSRFNILLRHIAKTPLP